MIPALYEKAKYEDVPQGVRDLFDKIKESKRGMYIHGDVGTGKTHMAYAMKMHWDKNMGARPAMFWNMTSLLHEIRADYDRPAYDRLHIEEVILNSRQLLFLDDVGAEKVTDWVGEMIYMIINHRYVERIPVIFTSNLPIGDLADRIGDRTASRIVEMCEIVELEGGDKRINQHSKINISI